MNGREKLVKGPVVLYEQMRAKIVELIRERNLQPHDPIPSEAELAAMYGVSTRTSKEALAALAREGVVYRMPRRGTFLAEQPGRPQSRGLIPLVLIVPDMDEYAGAIVQAAVTAAQGMGAEILLRVSGGDLREEEELLKRAALEAKGIILFPGDRRTCPDELLRLHLAQFPIVIVDRAYREINIPSVYHDHYRGGYELTSYLIAAGHRQIGFITADIEGVMSREDRYYGYMQALLDNRLPFTSSMVLSLPGAGREGDAMADASRTESGDTPDHAAPSDTAQNGAARGAAAEGATGPDAIMAAAEETAADTTGTTVARGAMGSAVNRDAPSAAAAKDTAAMTPAPAGGQEAALERFLDGHPELTAVFCANDEIAGQTLAACFRLGVKVPEQLSVAGFTDSLLARRLPVPLTTMRKPAGTLGEAAVRLLLERIGNPSVHPPSVKYPTELVVRESVRNL